MLPLGKRLDQKREPYEGLSQCGRTPACAGQGERNRHIRLSLTTESARHWPGAYVSGADPLELEMGHRLERFEHRLDDAHVVVVSIGLLVRALV